MPRAMMPERLRRFGGEDQGNAAVEFVLMTPILLLVAVGAFYMLSLISLYNTLYTSTYRAARYLSVEGEYLPSWEGAAQDAARRFIVDEFERQQSDNVWLKYASASTLNVRLSSPKPQCAGGSQGDRALQIQDVSFTLDAGLELSDVNIPVVKQVLGRGQPIRMVTRHTSFLECGQGELKE
ncbi:MAG: pilus assembly protein [Anaerolineae bacterium]|nr:pilus assembly protein [Anaerolineae bacterium]